MSTIYTNPRDILQTRLAYSDLQMELIDKILIKAPHFAEQGMTYQRLIEIGEENDFFWLRRVIYDATKEYTEISTLSESDLDVIYSLNVAFIDETYNQMSIPTGAILVSYNEATGEYTKTIHNNS